MKIVHPDLKHQIRFKENEIQVMIVENTTLFSEYVQDLYLQCNDVKDGRFVLSEGDKIMSLSKNALICINPFEIDINNKRIIGKLYNELKKMAYENEMYLQTSRLITEIEKYCTDISEDLDYDIEFDNNIDITGLFKVVNVRIKGDYDSLLERIVDYIDAMQKLLSVNICIFVNLKSYLGYSELEQLYEMMRYKKFKLLLLESREMEEKIPGESVYIIDKDACEIY